MTLFLEQWAQLSVNVPSSSQSELERIDMMIGRQPGGTTVRSLYQTLTHPVTRQQLELLGQWSLPDGNATDTLDRDAECREVLHLTLTEESDCLFVRSVEISLSETGLPAAMRFTFRASGSRPIELSLNDHRPGSNGGQRSGLPANPTIAAAGAGRQQAESDQGDRSSSHLKNSAGRFVDVPPSPAPGSPVADKLPPETRLARNGVSRIR